MQTISIIGDGANKENIDTIIKNKFELLKRQFETER
jgi:hypothetical protein